MTTLLDEEATRENIMFALARLSGAPAAAPAGLPPALASLTRANPEDTVVIYFAGHGLGTVDRFHLIPTDLRYSGSRDAVSSALPAILANAISDRDLEQVLEPLDARHILLVIDACDSGQALEATEPRFGPMNSRGLAQLAYEKGMAILTASQAYQAALEATALQHGYLTYALVEEGLKRFAADTFPKDGQVSSIEWAEYAVGRVPQLQLDAMNRSQANGRVLTFESVRLPRPDGCRRRGCSGAGTTTNAPSSSPAPDRLARRTFLEVAAVVNGMVPMVKRFSFCCCSFPRTLVRGRAGLRLN